MKVLALTRYGRLGASSRLRSLQFMPLLNKAGIDSTVQPLFGDEMLLSKYEKKKYGFGSVLKAYGKRVKQLMQRHQFDLVWIEKEALPWTPVFFEKIFLRGVPYVLDYDDAIFHNYDLHPSSWVRRLLGARIDNLMAGARLVIAGNEYLAQRARDAGAPWVEILPTVVDLDRYASIDTYRLTNVPRVVWIGSPSTVKYLVTLEESLKALTTRFDFKLRVIGGNVKMDGVNVECLPWTEDSEVQSIAECDIGIMPLNDSPWERGKCGYKLVQYMACELPVVASPVGVNKKIVRDGVNGFLPTSASGWVEDLAKLLVDGDLRKTMGQAGRRGVELEYCAQKVVLRLEKILLKAGATRCAD